MEEFLPVLGQVMSVMVSEGNQMEIEWMKRRSSFSKSYWWAPWSQRYPRAVDWESCAWDSSAGEVVLWGGFLGAPSRTGRNEDEMEN